MCVTILYASSYHAKERIERRTGGEERRERRLTPQETRAGTSTREALDKIPIRRGRGREAKGVVRM